MSILAECPICHKKQSINRKACKCGENLDRAKRSGRVNYYVNFRLPGGKQRRELVGKSIEDAKAAEGKRRAQKKEGRIFDMLPESKMTVSALCDWYLGLASVKRLVSADRLKYALANVTAAIGDRACNSLKPVDIENYMAERTAAIANVTIDYEITILKTVIHKAFDNDLIGGDVLKAFRGIKKISTRTERARDRVITIDEYQRIIAEAASHARAMMIVAFNTGMRPSEVRGLKWSSVDRKTGFIRLDAEETKERAPKAVPINHHVKAVLDAIPRHIDHDFVFTYKGKPIRRNKGPSDAFKSACRRAGVACTKKQGGIIPHDFRRTFKTNCVKAGVDKVYRDTITGHSLRGMDVHYIKPSEDDLTAAMDRFTAWLDAQLSTNVDQVLTKKA